VPKTKAATEGTPLGCEGKSRRGSSSVAALVRGQLWGTPREQKDSSSGRGPLVDLKVEVADVFALLQQGH
jgi:hypothetical protein